MKKLVLPMLLLTLSNTVVFGQVHDSNSNMQHEYIVNHEVAEKEYTQINGKVEEDPQERNVLLIDNARVSGDRGHWDRHFRTGPLSDGNTLNVWYRNDTDHAVRVTVDIPNPPGLSTIVTRFTVPGNSAITQPVQMMVVDYNANMRLTVENLEGRPVEGLANIRQIRN